MVLNAISVFGKTARPLGRGQDADKTRNPIL